MILLKHTNNSISGQIVTNIYFNKGPDLCVKILKDIEYCENNTIPHTIFGDDYSDRIINYDNFEVAEIDTSFPHEYKISFSPLVTWLRYNHPDIYKRVKQEIMRRWESEFDRRYFRSIN